MSKPYLPATLKHCTSFLFEHVMSHAFRDSDTTALGVPPLIVHLLPVLELSDERLFEFCKINRELRMERTAQGDLVIMPPTGGDTGNRNAELTMQLRIWAKRDGTGASFDTSTGFRLPNGAMRSPDASWVRHSRLDGLTPEEKRKFIPLAPDFAVELRSATDRLEIVQEKMQEYAENGTALGWLIDPELKRVSIYRPGRPVEQIVEPSSISGDPVLPGFVLDLNEIW